MSLRGAAQRVTIFIGESDRFRHRPLYAEIVHRAHKRGMAGASVFREWKASAPRPASTPAGCCP